MSNQTITLRKKSIRKTIFFTALLVGTLDALGAITVYQVNPGRIFRHIASGAVGSDVAFSGGIEIIVLGIAIHYFIASSWTILFFTLYQKLKAQTIPWPVTGITYGAVIWICMNLVILPTLSTLPMPGFTLVAVLKGMAILVVMIGLPLSYVANRFFKVIAPHS